MIFGCCVVIFFLVKFFLNDWLYEFLDCCLFLIQIRHWGNDTPSGRLIYCWISWRKIECVIDSWHSRERMLFNIFGFLRKELDDCVSHLIVLLHMIDNRKDCIFLSVLSSRLLDIQLKDSLCCIYIVCRHSDLKNASSSSIWQNHQVINTLRHFKHAFK